MDEQHLRNGAEVNDEYHGYAIATPGTLLVEKSADPEWLIRKFAAMRQVLPDAHAVFHSRLSTGSANTPENGQPLFCGDDTVVAHNGALPFREWALADGYSDTRTFAEFVFPQAFADLDDTATFGLLEQWATPANKLVFLTVDPRYAEQAYIVHRGQWIVTPEGVLHSNSDHLGKGAGWDEATSGDGTLWRWRILQPGQCPSCFVFGCDGSCPPKTHPGHAHPAMRDETARRALVAGAPR